MAGELNGIERIVLTSSLSACTEKKEKEQVHFGPEDWTDDLENCGSYVLRKTKAEKNAW